MTMGDLRDLNHSKKENASSSLKGVKQMLLRNWAMLSQWVD